MKKKVLSRALVAAAACVGTMAATAPAASAAVIVGTCATVGVVDFCVEEKGNTGVGEELYAVRDGEPVSLGKVAAYLDGYQFGSRVLPCVTPVVNGVEQNACAMFGLQRVSRIVLVEETTIGTMMPNPVVHGSIYVCTAELRATVAGFGEQGEAIFTVCGTDTPTFGTI